MGFGEIIVKERRVPYPPDITNDGGRKAACGIASRNIAFFFDIAGAYRMLPYGNNISL